MQLAHRLALGLTAALSTTLYASGGVAAADEPKNPDGFPTPSIATSLPQNGDPTGTRAALGARGITIGVNYTGEVLGNATGGVKRTATYFGLLEVTATIDFEKLAGWKGLTFIANGYQVHGHGLSTNNLGPNLHPVSDIEATPATRLNQARFQQTWLNDKITLSFGSLAADNDFFISDTAFPTVNATFGWPSAFAFGLPSGGPAYPLAAVATVLKVALNESLTTLVGVYNGDPVGPRCRVDPQLCNDHGLDFRLGDSTFAIAELQIKYNDAVGSDRLPGTVKLGAWKHSGSFADQRTDTMGLSLAQPDSSGLAKRRQGNHAFYALIDQTVYQSNESQKVNIFARYAALPSDRNLIDSYVDFGAAFTGFFGTRKDDSVITAFAYSKISNSARQLDQDYVAQATQAVVRNHEALLEVTYIAKILPGLTVQPDFQYIWNPGGKIDDGSGKPVADATVWALRTIINY